MKKTNTRSPTKHWTEHTFVYRIVFHFHFHFHFLVVLSPLFRHLQLKLFWECMLAMVIFILIIINNKFGTTLQRISFGSQNLCAQNECDNCRDRCHSRNVHGCHFECHYKLIENNFPVVCGAAYTNKIACFHCRTKCPNGLTAAGMPNQKYAINFRIPNKVN